MTVNLLQHDFVFKPAVPIVKLVEDLIDSADKNGASDIHIDPRANDVRIRFRIDGVLQDVCVFPKVVHNEFAARIKIISGLRIDERIVPQDGRLTVGDRLDIRVTTINSYYGESVIMRLLRRTATVETLETLGFSQEDQEAIMKSLQNKQGLILVTGPTGSGKTTTLYSLLSIVNDNSVSVVTIEDPVEYAISNARQINVQQKRGINFANGLRSILRQDPDVIMVGEIRDHETISIATSASLTGHLVLSTLHTNDAVSTIVRCVEMGIEPYLVAATLRLVINQRLIRKLCPNCKRAIEISSAERAMMEKFSIKSDSINTSNLPVYEAVGCDKCRGTGYLGRTVISEVLPITEKLAQMIVENKSLAQAQLNIKSLGHQAAIKYVQGVTSFEEAIKVINQ